MSLKFNVFFLHFFISFLCIKSVTSSLFNPKNLEKKNSEYVLIDILIYLYVEN